MVDSIEKLIGKDPFSLHLQEQQLRLEYDQRADSHKKLADRVHELLKSEVSDRKLHALATSCRLKEFDSVLEKVERKKYERPWEQIPDLAGVRVVCAHTQDLTPIQELIEELFEVHEREDKLKVLDVDKMGYIGRHFVVSIAKGNEFGVYKGLAGLRCEIQVRTALQDAWAMITHKLSYKSEAMIPKPLLRDLNNVSSLLEVAQGVFDAVREKREQYREVIAGKLVSGDTASILDQDTDLDTVTAYTRWRFPGCDINHKLTATFLQDLLLERYPKLRDIDIAVRRAEPAVKAYRRSHPDMFKTGTDILTKSLGFVDDDFWVKHRFGKVSREQMPKLRGLVDFNSTY